MCPKKKRCMEMSLESFLSFELCRTGSMPRNAAALSRKNTNKKLMASMIDHMPGFSAALEFAVSRKWWFR